METLKTLLIKRREELLEREERLRGLLLSTHAYAKVIKKLDFDNEFFFYEMGLAEIFSELLREASDRRGGNFRSEATHFYFDSEDVITSLENCYVEEFLEKEAAAAELLSRLSFSELLELFISLSKSIDTEEIENQLKEWEVIK